MGTWIDRIGVELEIEVDRTADGSVPSIDGFTVTDDGSISARDGGVAVEYVSEPLPFAAAGIDTLEDGVQELYGEHGARANPTMGLHVHVSFTSDFYYYALASMRFYEFFMARVRDSALWDRCPRLRSRAAGVTYAEPIASHHELDSALKTEPSGAERYRHFIYRPRKGTIEFRLFPAMDDPGDVLAAVNVITTAVNAYLREQRYRLDEELVVDVESVVPRGDAASIEEVVEYV